MRIPGILQRIAFAYCVVRASRCNAVPPGWVVLSENNGAGVAAPGFADEASAACLHR
eukprot:SAG31_NODE_3096_length_4680_cov_1.703995_8_plen_57_part_00